MLYVPQHAKGSLYHAKKFLLMISAIFMMVNSIPAIFKDNDNNCDPILGNHSKLLIR